MLIKVPDERAAQLKALADREGVTVTDLLGRFINCEIQAGRLADETPGFRFTPNGREICIDIEGVKVPPVSRDDARSLAKNMERVAKTGGTFLDMDAPGQPEIGRVGTGVYLKFSGAGAKGRRVIAPSVALDIARQLRRAAESEFAPSEIESVEQLLGDLEVGNDTDADAVIEDLSELESGT